MMLRLLRVRKKKSKNPAKNESGVALLITMLAVLFMIFMAVEISYNTHVELRVGSSQLDRLKAYYLAKAGVQVSLLRINAYKMVLNRFGAQLGANKADLDLVWSFPFAWPPILPPEASKMDQSQIDAIVKKSFIDGSFQTQIEGESGKIDINDLASPAQTLQKAVAAELTQMIQNRLDADDDWAHNHRDIHPADIINNIIDWISPNSQSITGGSKTSGYGNGDPPVNPPNRSIKTLNELHYIKGMTDDIYDILAPRVTVYGIKGVNVNYASAQVLQAIDKQMTVDIAKAIVDHRTDPKYGPFQGVQDFNTFLQQQGVNVQTFNIDPVSKNPVINLLFDSEINFRIKSTGIYGKAQREIVALVYDFDKVKGQLSQMVVASVTPTPPQATNPAQPPPVPTPTPTPTPANGAGGNAGPPTGPPLIVEWEEY